eukprot:gnl/TRDRNA2_/TRDRNA2_80056_c0_seq1.p1 gnl/TRDRNA2_/TRDRNA2_80056_c0~~gnl/TRDRNA2_/TRDRNA2_80056_c0_seq1.p1  ORF type:complete len:356 (+),score=28.92 gnl/TRDRNA2_/TRDRNA2_80056_c0_seq1:68-1135(+)
MTTCDRLAHDHMVASLVEMGFCARQASAALAVSSADTAAAIEQLLSNTQVMDLDTPSAMPVQLSASGSQSSGSACSENVGSPARPGAPAPMEAAIVTDGSSPLDTRLSSRRRASAVDLSKLPREILSMIPGHLSLCTGSRLAIVHRSFEGMRLAATTSLSVAVDMLPTNRPELASAAARSLGRRCGRLRELDFSGYANLTDSDIQALLVGCGAGLSMLVLSGCQSLTDESLSTIAKSCPNLQTVNLAGCQALTDRGLRKLAAGCPHLQSLYLNLCVKVADKGIHAIAAGCSHLSMLDVTGCRRVTLGGVLTARSTNTDMIVYPEVVVDRNGSISWRNTGSLGRPAPFTPSFGGLS